MDTHRDKQVVKALLAELTSTKYAAKLQGLESRQGTATAKRHSFLILRSMHTSKLLHKQLGMI